ncbi:MAG: hypothetical protein IPJ87_01235 [Flavobacteriales bacterium]|jgi:hypothetical protein|nr:hypothetical protein [Flavobacteriales bacterium]MBK7940500.1 hypothetical protein [Flavobacteriales bacterium]MBK8950241.1 hypothetical protein [Flavobacteriales bacterium]MBK9701077.1 hypothetical protein [Flavobacteriales bacterium]
MAARLLRCIAWIMLLSVGSAILPSGLGVLHACSHHADLEHETEQVPASDAGCVGCVLALAEAVVIAPLVLRPVMGILVLGDQRPAGTALAMPAWCTVDRGPPTLG